MAMRGRRPWREELKFKEVGALSAQVIKYCLSCPDEKFSLVEKARLAGQVYARLIPKDINVNLDGNISVKAISYALVDAIEKNEAEAEAMPLAVKKISSEPSSNEVTRNVTRDNGNA